jgi:hypothetical protein
VAAEPIPAVRPEVPRARAQAGRPRLDNREEGGHRGGQGAVGS